jgi:hypothetical protein
MKRFKLFGMTAVLIAISIITTVSLAQMQHHHDIKQQPGTATKSSTVTLAGEIVELSCFLEMNEKGKSHAACALTCISSGVPAALMESNGTLHTLVGSKMKPITDFIKENQIGIPVKITGKIINQVGSSFLIVEKVVSGK